MSVTSTLVSMSVCSLANDLVYMESHFPMREISVLPPGALYAWLKALPYALAGGAGVVVTCVALVARRTFGEGSERKVVSGSGRHRWGKPRVR